jgi:aspartate/methionine/tyrosine aminotransferase
MPSKLAERTRSFGETIFSEISALALQHGAVNLGQGFPDFAPPDFVLQAVQAAVEGEEHQYARGAGHLSLTEAIAAQIGPSLGRRIDPVGEVTITVGATEGLFAAALALLDPGDEAILFEPFYDCYPADAAIAGAALRYVPLQPDGRGAWGFDRDDLRRAFSPRTKLLFLNTPHNPTGKVFTVEELTLIAELCLAHDAVVVCDEVYEQIVFDGRQHVHLASLDGMWNRTLTLSSAGKTFSVTGWKIGWVVANTRLTAGLRKIHQWIPFAVATPLQIAVALVLQAAAQRDYYAWLRQMYQAKRDDMVEILRRAGMNPQVPEGTYYVIADTSALGFEDDVQLCRHLTTSVGVAAIPPSAFYCDAHRHLARHHARFCFCKREQTLRAAAERLLAAPIRSS